MSIPAKGVKGFILAHPNNGWVFRVYSEDKKQFKDYKLCADDFKIEIIDDYVHLYDEESKLGYAP